MRVQNAMSECGGTSLGSQRAFGRRHFPRILVKTLTLLLAISKSCCNTQSEEKSMLIRNSDFSILSFKYYSNIVTILRRLLLVM